MNEDLQVLYLDNHVLVAYKPAGIPTQPTFEATCRAWLKAHRQKPAEAYLHVIHRLDTPVSGIVICACTSKALSRLHASIRDGQLRKQYLALVTGSLPHREGRLEHYLFHDMHSHRSKIVSATTPHAQKAVLSYRILDNPKAGITSLAIQLHTGRYHQIRVQLSAAGCPILGDLKYGSRHPFHKDAIALHHESSAFPHPTLHTTCEIQAPLPNYWVRF